ncbi:NAD(P)-binding protein [Dichomitus squalens]|uniref:D-xylose 1-dehydrogenase (NADP(+), D-xylono-1,5-lactone-forming) n=1 Tax=Dichomitus squalens TaxID=114155 RepID=A0A4Q9NTU2_9APHY|nr:NAD(P)-binding protein [Dichomitus squalens LYAD-421 SS1]EJF64256.1 NAD(P)-binding protein [Dichomitus squalens LYAD-421 SS1]TBU30644.1 NAD(P)-binding protein [Dichomitus squalens]TBU43502.1 NAD(P)-binding protein [Dichomitus squalens]TBU60992.1 NAD(P)-binding protein [Dichomitus squalens]
MAFELRWGIISTGRIAMEFVKDLLVDPASRDVTDVAHKVVAVGSRSTESAQKFIDAYINGDNNVKAYGSYAEVFADKNVDAVYIGTPHTLHYENAVEALNAGKHVLCEKATTSNAAETKSLIKLAKEKKLFFMEALWTRFHPLTLELKKIAEEGTLGDPVVLHADLSADFHIEDKPLNHRMLDPKLGGGALLDLGPYPMFWAMLALYEHPSNKNARPTSVTGSILKSTITDVDASTSWTVNFTEHLKAQAILSCSMIAQTAHFGAVIRYKKGNIKVATPIFRPPSFTVEYFDGPGGNVVREETRSFSYVGGGWHFEADEVARCIKAGKIESDLWTHEKTIIIMETFDEVRRQGKYVLPEGVEKVDRVQ